MSERLSIYLEPAQEALLAPLLRTAVLSGRSVMADCTRSQHGVRVTFGIISCGTARKIQRILEQEEPKPQPELAL